jgi:hypothetical protein
LRLSGRTGRSAESSVAVDCRTGVRVARTIQDRSGGRA